MKKYSVRCVRSGAWWAISVPEIEGLFSQARHLDQADGMAREAIALMLEVGPQSFAVDIQPSPTPKVTQRGGGTPTRSHPANGAVQ